ncbi:MAG TPA: hypothetical protein VKU19_25510 [Bryobacteraceae bacterium]|nr:hypothetical protein [Bryobacteraceae bacterium]
MIATAERQSGRDGELLIPPVVLLDECTVHESGIGPLLILEENQGAVLIVTLEITRGIEGQSLGVSLLGSSNGNDWEPVLQLPKKYYCGSYPAVLDLSPRPAFRYLRVEWDVKRWAMDGRAALFTFGIGMQNVSGCNTRTGAQTFAGLA